MMKFARSIIGGIDRCLNGVTMYRLVLYGLGLLYAAGVSLGFLGVTRLSGFGLLASLAILIAGCYAVNKVLAWAWDVGTNSESWLITALILGLILPPATTAPRALAISLAALLAMASKYIVAWRGKHLCNPAAFGAVAVGLLGIVSPTWWVGSKPMLPFTLIVGLLIIRKVRRFQLVIVFALVAIAIMLALGIDHGRTPQMIIEQSLTSWPSVFFASIMLTEPATMPPKRPMRLLYGALVGVLYAAQLQVGPVSVTPEMALVLGNICAFALSPRFAVVMRLKAKRQLTANSFEYVFAPQRPFSFQPGQYMEWTLPHKRVDSRGNRRTFTIASSPTEPDIRLGVKFYKPPSSYKQALLRMQPGDNLVARQLAGDFVLPKNPSQKLVLIAGGIGITPFRSQLKYLMDTKQQRDIALFYVVNDESDVAYRDILQAAQGIGVRVFVVSPRLTPEQLHTNAPDYQTRTFYISGPNGMVSHYAGWLHDQGVGIRRIVTDYFSGY
ncbi:MAG TPA: hypothetical protein VJP80_06125 [Candidatus Saccharimonadales bacterium]|nr:hypothetical protein [Candidatus Saccharimonadales bacterium]